MIGISDFETKKAEKCDFSKSPPTLPLPVSMRQKMSHLYFATIPKLKSNSQILNFLVYSFLKRFFYKILSEMIPPPSISVSLRGPAIALRQRKKGRRAQASLMGRTDGTGRTGRLPKVSFNFLHFKI